MDSDKQKIDRPWSDYPIGTKAYSITGGYWTKVNLGWKWQSGSTYVRPGADAFAVTMPKL